jgi:very-short-patch-repair endonuclease
VGVLAMPNLRARSLRSNATDAERSLWQQLRLLKSEGRHFRRQVPLAGYIADFACHGCKLAIELDGGQHNRDAAIAYDAQRTDHLAREGYMVLRFWNSDVLTNMEGVVDTIRHHAGLETAFNHREGIPGATPTPNPSPQGGGA